MRQQAVRWLQTVHSFGNPEIMSNYNARELSREDIQNIADTYHAWRAGEGAYEYVKGFYASVLLKRVIELDYVQTSACYVGLPDEEDNFNFAERFAALNKAIAENLAKVKV